MRCLHRGRGRPSSTGGGAWLAVCSGVSLSVRISRSRFTSFSLATCFWLEALGGSRHYLYPVHISHTFISCPSVGAALYLLLLRLLARQYDAAARVAPLCVSDATLSAEEAQLVRALADAAEDQHPDAHACRLRLSLAALHTPMYDALPWRLGEQLAGYAAKAAHVSFACHARALERGSRRPFVRVRARASVHLRR